MTALRPDGRQPDQMRPVRITPGYLAHAEGSACFAFVFPRARATMCAAYDGPSERYSVLGSL